MQKTKQELNANIVGAGPVSAQKGITLIALIITIIVMLILVGVTINVALNGGLFTKAEQATKETEEKAILEEMLAMMEITDEGKINSGEIIKKMRVNYPEIKYDESTKIATITGKLGTYNYIVSEKEIKIGENIAPPEDLDLNYIKNFCIGIDIESLMEKGQKEGFDATFVTATFGEMTNEMAASEKMIVLYKENYYEIKFDEAAIAYEIYSWGTEMPVVVNVTGAYYGDVKPSGSNNAFQKAGEYRTTILLGDGKYAVADNSLTIEEIISLMIEKTYVEGVDYTFNTSTGEIVIFNLTEPITISVRVERKTT